MTRGSRGVVEHGQRSGSTYFLRIGGREDLSGNQGTQAVIISQVIQIPARAYSRPDQSQSQNASPQRVLNNRLLEFDEKLALHETAIKFVWWLQTTRTAALCQPSRERLSEHSQAEMQQTPAKFRHCVLR